MEVILFFNVGRVLKQAYFKRAVFFSDFRFFDTEGQKKESWGEMRISSKYLRYLNNS